MDMSDEVLKPLATTRSRRANAGNRMGTLMLEEEDEFYTDNYGGFQEEEDDEDFDFADDDHDDDEDDCDDDDDVDDSDDDDDNDDTENEARDQDEGRSIDGQDDIKLESTNSIEHKTQAKRIKTERSTAVIKTENCFKACADICSVCLSEQVEDDDEIIECDSCHVTVHESCYGVSSDVSDQNDDASNQSNISSESTEPWFCEPCMRSVRNPYCELCPNLGGIFKQTDTGRWVHMVCALYTRGVTFENINNLTNVSLFEIKYQLYGAKACTICEDRRLARSGICIECDAGLCKTFFHATCAQKEGLLFASHTDEVDPYFAQCKQHADKQIIKKKKKTCTALFARLREVNSSSVLSERVKNKLDELVRLPNVSLSRWTIDNLPPIPQKVSRLLLTSPSVIIKLTKKSELMGLDPHSAFMSIQDEMEIARKKWHIPPAFNLEFIAYCQDRKARMVLMKKRHEELVRQNSTLMGEEENLRRKLSNLKGAMCRIKEQTDTVIEQIFELRESIVSSGRNYSLPQQTTQMIEKYSSLVTAKKGQNKASKLTPTAKSNATYTCDKCKTVKDQHLLSLCDTCECYFHIYCLDPPLSRVPKKTKFGGWQCSDCSERDEEQDEALGEQADQNNEECDGPRRLRERINAPEKYCLESMTLADFWSTAPRRRGSRRSRNKSASKKVKLEAA